MKININWCNFPYKFNEPEATDLLTIEPIPVLKFHSEVASANHRKCPAHTNYFKNTYVMCSPIDFEVVINKENNFCDVVEPKKLPQICFNPRFEEEHESPYPIFSLGFNLVLFMPVDTEKNIYLEQLDPVLDWDRDPNIRVISGNFNISKWLRPLECAFEQRTKNLTVKFKRGQPMYYFRFITDDPEDNIVLNRVDITKEIFDDAIRCTKLKVYAPINKLKTIYEIRDRFIKSFKRGA